MKCEVEELLNLILSELKSKDRYFIDEVEVENLIGKVRSIVRGAYNGLYKVKCRIVTIDNYSYCHRIELFYDDTLQSVVFFK